jgi:hypothetical protein
VGAVARWESSEPACPERMARWFPPYGPGPLENGFRRYEGINQYYWLWRPRNGISQFLEIVMTLPFGTRCWSDESYDIGKHPTHGWTLGHQTPPTLRVLVSSFVRGITGTLSFFLTTLPK